MVKILYFFLTLPILFSCGGEIKKMPVQMESDTIPESLLNTNIKIINSCDTLCSTYADFRMISPDDEFIGGEVNRSYTKNYNLNIDSFPGLRIYSLVTFVSGNYKLKEAQVWYKNCAGVSIINGVVFIHNIDEKLDYSLIVCLDTLEYIRIPEYKWVDDTTYSLERKQTDLDIFRCLLKSRLYSARQFISVKPVYVPDAE